MDREYKNKTQNLNGSELSDAECAAMSVVGCIMINHQKHSDAMVIFEALCMIDSSNIHAHKALAYLYVETKQFKLALNIVEMLREVVKMDRSTLAAISLLESRAFLGLNLTSKAKQSMRDYRHEVSQL